MVLPFFVTVGRVLQPTVPPITVFWPKPAGSNLSLQIVSVTNAACNSYSNVTYLVSYWPPWTVEVGGMPSFFSFRTYCRTDPGGDVSPPTTGLQKGQQWSGVFIGFFPHFFSGRTDCRYSKACPWNVSRKIRRSFCVWSISSHINAKSWYHTETK